MSFFFPPHRIGIIAHATMADPELYSSISKRLSEMTGDTDSNLVDYIVLISGTHSGDENMREKLVADLDAFFGGQTNEFVDWLIDQTVFPFVKTHRNVGVSCHPSMLHAYLLMRASLRLFCC